MSLRGGTACPEFISGTKQSLAIRAAVLTCGCHAIARNDMVFIDEFSILNPKSKFRNPTSKLFRHIMVNRLNVVVFFQTVNQFHDIGNLLFGNGME